MRTIRNKSSCTMNKILRALCSKEFSILEQIEIIRSYKVNLVIKFERKTEKYYVTDN